MKICVINDHFSIGPGGQHRIQNLSRGFEALGHKVLYVCPYGISAEVSDLFIEKTQSYRSPIYTKYISPYFNDFFKIFKKIVAHHIKCDFFVVELPNTMMKSLNALYGKVEGIPVTFDFGGLWASFFDKGKIYGDVKLSFKIFRPFAQIYEDALALLSSGLPTIITVPTSGLKLMLEKFLKKREVHVIYYPVDTCEKFNPSLVNCSKIREKLPNQYKNKQLVMLGVKMGIWFIPFIEKLIYEHKIRDLAFLVLGSFPNAKVVCEKKALSEYIYFTGNIPNSIVPQYIAMTEFAVALTHPSLRSIWYAPHNINKIGEYLAMGKAVVTDTMGASDYVKNGQNGFIVRDYDELVERIFLLSQDSELRFKMGKNARAFAYEKLDYIRVASSYISLINGR